MDTIANRLRLEIARCGWSLNEVARRSGIDVGHLCRFVHGKTGISLDNAQVLVDLFDLVLVPRSEVKQGRGRKPKGKR